MSAFLFAFAAVALTSLGSRDQLLVAHLAGRLGKTLGLLATGLLVSVLTAGLMAWAGSTISAMLPPAAKSMLVAIALVVAGVELAWPRQMRLAAEPTRSLGAIGLVLFGYQITDAARFLVFALAAGFAFPPLAGAGGALGGAAALVLGWVAGDQLAGWPLRAVRIALGALLLLTGLFIASSIRGLIY